MFEFLPSKQKALYLTPHDFLKACKGYFEWAIKTPLQEEQVFQYKGMILRADKAKVRAFTKTGLAQHLGIPNSRLQTYRERGDEWEEAVELVEQAIYNQKFENAAAGLMNATIIARDLGLSEKQEFGGMKDAPPIGFTINPVTAGTFIAPAEQKTE